MRSNFGEEISFISNSGKELCFGGAGSSDRLRFASVRDDAATEEEGLACSRLAITQIIGVCGIKECNGFLGIHSGKIRWLSTHGGADEVGRRKGSIWLGPMVNDAPVFSSLEVFCNRLEHGKVMVMRTGGELS